MNYVIRRVTFALFMLLQGCVFTSPVENEYIDLLVIHNETKDVLKNVVLSVPARNIIVSANAILPHREYSLGFPEMENKRESAMLSWEQAGIHYKREIKTVIPQNLDKNDVFLVKVTIRESGEMTSVIKPKPVSSSY